MIIIIKNTNKQKMTRRQQTPHHRFLPFTIHTAAVQVESTSTSVLNNTDTQEEEEAPHHHVFPPRLALLELLAADRCNGAREPSFVEPWDRYHGQVKNQSDTGPVFHGTRYIIAVFCYSTQAGWRKPCRACVAAECAHGSHSRPGVNVPGRPPWLNLRTHRQLAPQ